MGGYHTEKGKTGGETGQAVWKQRIREQQKKRQRQQRMRVLLAAGGILLVFLAGVLVGRGCGGDTSEVHAWEQETTADMEAPAPLDVSSPDPGQRAARRQLELPDYVDPQYLTVNPYSRPGTATEEIRSVVVHYIGNPGTTAQQNRDYFEELAAGEEGIYMSSNFVVGLEGEVIACVPPGEVAYASNNRNHDTVSIENCHPDASGKFTRETYQSLVRLTAWLCGEYGLDPRNGGVIRHHDVTGKDCPKYFVEHPEAWEQFLQDVEAQMQDG